MRRILAALALTITAAVAGCKTKEQPVAAAARGLGAPAAAPDTSGLVTDKLLVDGHLGPP